MKTKGLSIHCAERTQGDFPTQNWHLDYPEKAKWDPLPLKWSASGSRGGRRPTSEGPPWGSPLALRVREQKRKLKLHKQEATTLAGEEGCGGAVAMASVYQTQAWGRVGAPGRNIHSAQKWSGGAQPGQRQGRGSRSGILRKGHFTGTHVQGLPQGSNCGGNGSMWRREVTSVGVDM